MDTSLIGLISQAGTVGKLVLVLLLIASILSWGVVFKKLRELRLAEKSDQKFLAQFWISKDLEELFARLDKFNPSPIAAIFGSGMKEFRRFKNILSQHTNPSEAPELENIARCLNKSSTQETAKLEHQIIWLATIASSGPFVGLFGTVWGIMTSFQRIGQSGAANLAVVAPGISEALIATAAGIGAAIPAAIFYNYFLSKIKRITIEMDGFSQDFLNIVRRSHFNSEIASRKNSGESHGISST